MSIRVVKTYEPTVIPESFNCPISLEEMKDPVIDQMGHSFERGAIVEWIRKGNSTCPLGTESLKIENLIPNRALKDVIEQWHQQEDKRRKSLESSVLTLQGHTRIVNRLLKLDDDTFASASDDCTIKLWNLNGKCIRILKDKNMDSVANLLLLQDGTLASHSYDEAIRLWDWNSGECLQILKHPDIINSFIETIPEKLAVACSDKTIKLWDRNGSYESFIGHTRWVRVVIQLQDHSLASGSNDGTIRLWDLTGTCLLTLKGHTASVRALIELQNGNLASGSEDKTIKIWNRYKGQCLRTYQHFGCVSSLCELKDGTLLSDSCDNNTIRRWDQQGNLLFTFPGHDHYVDKPFLELQDGILATCADHNAINLWDLNNDYLGTLKGHTDSVETFIEPKEGFLASGSRDATINIWNFQQGTNY